MNLYNNEKVLLPLMIHENYPLLFKFKNKNKNNNNT